MPLPPDETQVERKARRELCRKSTDGHAHEHKPHEHRHHEHHRRQLTEKEIKELEKRRRFFSKLEHYLSEYAPYAILALVVLAIFIGALYLSITKV